MNICYLAPANSIHTVRWVNAFANRGYNVHLLTIQKPEQDEIHPDVTIHFLPFKTPFGYYLNFMTARRIINQIAPDFVHVHFASGYGTLGRFVDYHPMLLSVWGSDVFEFPYHNSITKKILQKNLRAADQIGSTSWVMKEQTEKFITPEKEIAVTPFGVDVDKFSPNNELKIKDKVTIGMIKSLKEVYGHKYLIEAFAKLVQQLREEESQLLHKVNLLLVGDGEQRDVLFDLVATLGISDYVHFTGAAPHNQVPDYLNQIDIFCAPSLSESFGVAVIEASSCEVPVVVSNVGGLPEVVKNGETGYIVEPKNVEQLAEKLYLLVNDQELRLKMGEAGRKFILEDYDWEKNVEKMEKVYRDLIK